MVSAKLAPHSSRHPQLRRYTPSAAAARHAATTRSPARPASFARRRRTAGRQGARMRSSWRSSTREMQSTARGGRRSLRPGRGTGMRQSSSLRAGRGRRRVGVGSIHRCLGEQVAMTLERTWNRRSSAAGCRLIGPWTVHHEDTLRQAMARVMVSVSATPTALVPADSAKVASP